MTNFQKKGNCIFFAKHTFLASRITLKIEVIVSDTQVLLFKIAAMNLKIDKPKLNTHSLQSLKEGSGVDMIF